MKAVRATSVLWIVTALAAPATAQESTLARLNHESVHEVTHPRIDAPDGPRETIAARSSRFPSRRFHARLLPRCLSMRIWFAPDNLLNAHCDTTIGMPRPYLC